MSEDEKSEADYFRADVEALLKRYGNLSVYATIGALEVVKANMLDQLFKLHPGENNSTQE